MIVKQLSTFQNGGAGVAAYRLSEALENQGINSSIIDKASTVNNLFNFLLQQFEERQNTKLRKKFKRQYECLSLERTFSFNLSLSNNTDIINLHWISAFIDYKNFFQQENLPPIVWTLHDMNLFLGLAHYQSDAKLLREELAGGRNLDESGNNDLDFKVWNNKKSIFARLSKDRIHFVCPSHWLANEAKKSFIKEFPITVIPNGIDTKILKPIERKEAKKILSIPQNQNKNILFVADSVKNTRKGIDVLLQALGILDKNSDYQVLIMGKDFKDEVLSFPVINLGYISDDRLKACVYSSADIFVIPSREDNLPNTVLEAMACGTPTIGSNVGGIPDMVRPGITGDLFEVGNAEDLASKIEAWFKCDDLEAISRKCREVAVSEYDVSLQAQRYKKLYESILAK